MKITGQCQECKKEKAVVRFSASVETGGRTRFATASGHKLRKLCRSCYQAALQKFSNLARDVQS